MKREDVIHELSLIDAKRLFPWAVKELVVAVRTERSWSSTLSDNVLLMSTRFYVARTPGIDENVALYANRGGEFPNDYDWYFDSLEGAWCVAK